MSDETRFGHNASPRRIDPRIPDVPNIFFKAQGPDLGPRPRAQDPGPGPGPGTRDQAQGPGPRPMARARDPGPDPGYEAPSTHGSRLMEGGVG